MTYEDIVSLGWKPRHKRNDNDKNHTFYFGPKTKPHWIFSFFTHQEEDGTHTVLIKYVDESVRSNEWENSEPVFYGYLKTKEDLRNLMRFAAIIEY